MISKILLGDISDNIKGCSIDSRYLKNEPININSENKNSNTQANDSHSNVSITYKNITKTLIKNLINDTTKYNMFKDMLYKIRLDSENAKLDINVDIGINLDMHLDMHLDRPSNNSICIIQNNKFNDNTILMDFKMLPNELKIALDSKFKEIV